MGEGDHLRGSQKTPVTLLEDGDYECPYCGRAHPPVKEALEEARGQIRFVFRHFPLDPVHPNARLAADAAEAAGAQGRFCEMHDLLYSNQDRLSESDLLRHAARLGLDAERFERDLASLRHARLADEHRAGGERSGVDLLLLFDAGNTGRRPRLVRATGADGVCVVCVIRKNPAQRGTTTPG